MRHPLLNLVLAALAAEGCAADVKTACLAVEDDVTTCPMPDEVDVDELFLPGECGLNIVRVTSEDRPEVEGLDTGLIGSICCYEAVVRDPTPTGDCIVGRPFEQSGVACVAPSTLDEGPAGVWQRMALAEHASVAAFSRLSLELLALGAPLELLAAVQAAAGDEVRHAQLCSEVAVALGGAAVRPGPFPFEGAVRTDITLAELAASALSEGCFGETLAALVAAESAQRATHSLAARALAGIAADEARHAALSWRIVAWALRAGGEGVRVAVLAAVARGQRPGPAAAHEGWSELGCAGPEQTRAAVRRGLVEVVQPALAVLLAA